MKALWMALLLALASATFAPTTALADDDGEGPQVCEYTAENPYFCT